MLTDPTLVHMQSELGELQGKLDATKTFPSVTAGTTWNQVCDSEGPHRRATISVTNGRTHVVWTPSYRTEEQVAKYGWDNIYIWQETALTARRFSADVAVTVADQYSFDSLHVFEHEVHKVYSDLINNMAWQIRKNSANPLQYWTFDFAHDGIPGKWVDSGLRSPFTDFTPAKKTRFVSLCEAIDGPHHLGLSVNGLFSPVSIQRPPVPVKPEDRGKLDHVNFAFQLGGSNKEVPIAVDVEYMLVTL